MSQRPLEQPPEVHPYPQESRGPDAVYELIAPRTWRLPLLRTRRRPHERRALRLGEAPLAEARVPRERTADPLDLDQIGADEHGHQT